MDTNESSLEPIPTDPTARRWAIGALVATIGVAVAVILGYVFAIQGLSSAQAKRRELQGKLTNLENEFSRRFPNENLGQIEQPTTTTTTARPSSVVSRPSVPLSSATPRTTTSPAVPTTATPVPTSTMPIGRSPPPASTTTTTAPLVCVLGTCVGRP